MKRFFRWILNKDELDAIRRELASFRVMVQTEIERQKPKQREPVGPVKPVGAKE